MKSLSRVWLFAIPWTIAYQGPLSMGFSRNTGVGCHFLLQEIFPTQGLNPGLPHCRQTLYCLSHQGSPSKYSQRPKIRRQLCRRSTGRGKSLSSKTYQERPLLLSKWMIVAWIWATVMDGEKLLGHWIYSKYIQLIACTAAFWFFKNCKSGHITLQAWLYITLAVKSEVLHWTSGPYAIWWPHLTT